MRKSNWQIMCEQCSDSPGLYSVWAGDRLLYIGKAKSVRKRLINHIQRWNMIECGADKIIEMSIIDNRSRSVTEAFLIWRWKPPLNAMVTRLPFRCSDWVASQGQNLTEYRKRIELNHFSKLIQ